MIGHNIPLDDCCRGPQSSNLEDGSGSFGFGDGSGSDDGEDDNGNRVTE